MGSIPRLRAATWVLNRVLRLGFKKSNPMRFPVPRCWSLNGAALCRQRIMDESVDILHVVHG